MTTTTTATTTARPPTWGTRRQDARCAIAMGKISSDGIAHLAALAELAVERYNEALGNIGHESENENRGERLARAAVNAARRADIGNATRATNPWPRGF